MYLGPVFRHYVYISGVYWKAYSMVFALTTTVLSNTLGLDQIVDILGWAANFHTCEHSAIWKA